MSIFQAVILGVIQGITEFFPISSSGHLVIAQSLFGLEEPRLAFDIFLHLGTLLSVLIFFRNDIIRLFTTGRKLGFLLVVASLPTFIIALLFKDLVESYFGMPKQVGCMFIITGAWLAAAYFYDIFRRARATRQPGLANSFIIGIAQGIAIMPGISRSGATISTGILAGLEKAEAVRFSFLLAAPAILGASVFKMRNIAQGATGADALSFIAGGVAAMLAGLAAIKFLLDLVKKGKLYYFAVYCILAGSFVIIRW